MALAGAIIIPRVGSRTWISMSPYLTVGSPKSTVVSGYCSGSRSLRTTTAPTPIARSASGDRALTCPSRPRMASGLTSGTASRTAKGTWVSAWIGSSRVQPQVCRAKDASGTTSVRVPPMLLFRYSAAASQSGETSFHVPVGARRRDQAGATAMTAASPTATALGNFTRASTAATPMTSGKRTSGSSLCRFRKGAPGPSRKPSQACPNGPCAAPMSATPRHSNTTK